MPLALVVTLNVLIRSGAHRRAKAEAVPADVATPPVVVEPITYQQADAGKLAGAVAKEVGKTLAPIIGVVLLVLAIVIYLIAR